MTSFADLLAQGTAHAWLFIPTAILLGALHGLEPGHSKSMMAAFIIAVRGTVKQAILLGLSTTLSHTLIVWAIALGGLYLWRDMNAKTSEPYFQLVSGIIILGVAIWMFMRTRISLHHHHDHDHSHDHSHDHHHDDEHARAHAHEIEEKFSGAQKVTNGQIIMFGLTGGLIPCPAAITVLLLCLQLKEITLGATLVLSFSIGLAVTLVAVGVAAAISLNHVQKSNSRLRDLMYKAPYFSAGLMALVGIYMTVHGVMGIIN
jgi:nickel/cobalt exporter